MHSQDPKLTRIVLSRFGIAGGFISLSAHFDPKQCSGGTITEPEQIVRTGVREAEAGA